MMPLWVKETSIFKRWLFFNLAYLRHPRWETGLVPPELIQYADGHTPGRALDLGCGSGLNSLYLAGQGWSVDGVDFSLHAVLKARRRTRKADRAISSRVCFHAGNAARLENVSLTPPYDLVLDIGCLHGLGSEDAARACADSVIRLLKPGGDYLLYAHHAESNGYPLHGLNLEWVQMLFTPGLDLMEYRPGDELHRPPERKAAWYFLRKLS